MDIRKESRTSILYNSLRAKLSAQPYQEVRIYEFMPILNKDIPLTYDLAALLVRHPSTPDSILWLITDNPPTPPCINPYCISNYDLTQKCPHTETKDKSDLFLNLTNRRDMPKKLIIETVKQSQKYCRENVFTKIAQSLVSYPETPEEVLGLIATSVNDYACLKTIINHPNSNETISILCVLKISDTPSKEAETLADHLMARINKLS
jgi:hypothetical protein